jgi:NTE family protein
MIGRGGGLRVKVDGVFEGGGMKAIGLAGAIGVVESKGFTWNRTAGTSSGAIIASLLAAGYTAKEIQSIIFNLDFFSMLDKAWFQRIPLGTTCRIFFRKGMYSGRLIEDWIYRLLADKGVYTFGDLKPGSLRIIASDITRGKLLILPDDIKDYGIDPDYFSVSKAVRMSLSIPYFFDPMSLNFQGRSILKSFIVDGALLSNYPIWLFDKEDDEEGTSYPKFGFNLYGENEGKPHHVRGPFTMFRALFSTMLDAMDQRFIEEIDSVRTIFIPTLGVKTTDFKLSDEKKKELLIAGEKAAEKFFDGWSYNKYLLTQRELKRKQPIFKIQGEIL